MILIGQELKNAEINIIGVFLALKLIVLYSFSNWTNTCLKKKKKSKTFKHKISLRNCSSSSAK